MTLDGHLADHGIKGDGACFTARIIDVASMIASFFLQAIHIFEAINSFFVQKLSASSLGNNEGIASEENFLSSLT